MCSAKMIFLLIIASKHLILIIAIIVDTRFSMMHIKLITVKPVVKGHWRVRWPLYRGSFTMYYKQSRYQKKWSFIERWPLYRCLKAGLIVRLINGCNKANFQQKLFEA